MDYQSAVRCLKDRCDLEIHQIHYFYNMLRYMLSSGLTEDQIVDIIKGLIRKPLYGPNVVYADTDSIKVLSEEEVEE